MYFVPVPPPTPVSPRTRELADLLGRVIEEYEKHHPAVSGAEVREAVRMAARSSRAGGPEAARLVVAALAGVLVLGGVVAWILVDRGGMSEGAAPMVLVAVILFAVLTTLVVLKRLRGG